jgi:hypothetical protein
MAKKRFTEQELKEHQRESERKYRLEHPEAEKERGRKYRLKNQERDKERHRKYNLEHKEECKKYWQKYRLEHKEDIKKYALEHKEHHKEYNRKYCLEHQGEIKTKRKAYRASHREQTKERFMKKNYGIGLAEYEKIFAKQNGVCAICGEPPNGKSFHVDHDHDTRKVRGLLCGTCNVGLGYFMDNVTILHNAEIYLIKSQLETS